MPLRHRRLRRRCAETLHGAALQLLDLLEVRIPAPDRAALAVPPHARRRESVDLHVHTGVAKHYFCRTCGMKPFYVPRSNPDGMDVNVNCLDPVPQDIAVAPFDGRDWEA